jgi:hypothetical protein
VLGWSPSTKSDKYARGGKGREVAAKLDSTPKEGFLGATIDRQASSMLVLVLTWTVSWRFPEIIKTFLVRRGCRPNLSARLYP